ncbi:MAG: hypothetical protein UV37_C0005G0004 [Candidatus Collierbacteria bacterium GW2011_GWA1_42_60]|nr:MAG: hypothetical protein UV37_C0005G0004 [Candidatus Collierbacteria bacterium GW2011_GWA1_42_60]
MLIDTHCHLTDSKFTDVKGVIAEAVDAGVEKIFMPSGSVENARRTVLIAEQEGLYAMVGVHPEEIESVTDVNFITIRRKKQKKNSWKYLRLKLSLQSD